MTFKVWQQGATIRGRRLFEGGDYSRAAKYGRPLRCKIGWNFKNCTLCEAELTTALVIYYVTASTQKGWHNAHTSLCN